MMSRHLWAILTAFGLVTAGGENSGNFSCGKAAVHNSGSINGISGQQQENIPSFETSTLQPNFSPELTSLLLTGLYVQILKPLNGQPELYCYCPNQGEVCLKIFYHSVEGYSFSNGYPVTTDLICINRELQEGQEVTKKENVGPYPLSSLSSFFDLANKYGLCPEVPGSSKYQQHPLRPLPQY